MVVFVEMGETMKTKPNKFRRWLDRNGLTLFQFPLRVPDVSYNWACKAASANAPKRVHAATRFAIAKKFPTCPLAK